MIFQAEIKTFIKSLLNLGLAPYRYIYSKNKLRTLLKADEIKLDIGSGEKREGWITVDINFDCDLSWNLMWGFPFKDQSVDQIYSSHFFEHFSYRQLKFLLSECHRVLKPGGEIWVSVPNAALFVNAYNQGSNESVKSLMAHPDAIISDLKMDTLNYMFYMDGHHFHMFETENLLALLSNSGFTNVEERNYVEGLDPPFRREESIFAKASKLQ